MTATIEAQPAASLVLPPGAGRDVWLAERRKHVGGSDIAAIMNVSPYDGPMSTWMDKVHGRTKKMTDAMSIGIHMEPWIMNKFAAMNRDLHVVASPGMYVVDNDLDDNGHRWRSANPDGIATLTDGRRALIEAKTARRYGDDTCDTWGDEGTDEIPYAYLCQVTWNCAALNCELWVVPVLFDGGDYREYRGRFEPALAETLIDHARNWWNANVVGDGEPAADYRESTRTILNDRYGAAEATRKTFGPAGPDALLWQADFCQLREQIKTLKQRQDERANLLRQAHVKADVQELRHAGNTISTMITTKTGSVRLNVKELAS